MDIISYLIAGIIWGVISNYVGKSKNINGFWWGFFLGFIGLIIVICMKPKETVVIDQIDKNITKENKYDELEKLDNLRKVGAITEYEFEQEKNKLLK